ncbi:MAG: ABC transporter substrate-binding protein [Candidatus Competibacteraceae bacterium]|nr:ABC transporter substrate-binding protein [Candidatus Competibacteraceae bacterium]
MVAVVGHASAATAVPASITYEDRGILFINPAVTDPSLNKHGFRYVFTTIPNNEQFGQQMATFGFGLGYRRVAILNSREDWADQTTKAFTQDAITLGMTVVVRRSFFANRENFRDIIADLGAFQFDALFLAADEVTSATIVRQSMEMNLSTPLLLAELIDILAFREEVGVETPHVTVPVLFNPLIDRRQVGAFRAGFKDRFGGEPDGWAAQGYDAIQMLAQAMAQANSPVPLSIATILRYTLSWQGITGRHSFNRGGAIYTKALEFATLEKGKIEFHSADGGVVEYQEPSADQVDENPSDASKRL